MHKSNTKDFIIKSKLIHNVKYDYSLVKYNNSISKVSIICHMHGVFKQVPNSHLNGRGCPKCSNNNFKKTEEDFIDSCEKIFTNNKYGYDNVKYINSKTNVEIVCPKHGSFYKTPNSHLNGRGCPKCKRKQIYFEMFKEKSDIIYNNKFIYISKVINSQKDIVDIICPIHGQFTQRVDYHLKGGGCINCNKINIGSKKEIEVENILIENNIKYIKEKTFNLCVYKKKLPFDFYLPDYNICIECDGEQHFKPIRFFGGVDFYNLTLARDKIKTDYCIKNNIKLIRIPYSSINLFISFNSSLLPSCA